MRFITLLGAAIGAAIAGSSFFTDFTNYKNWRNFGGYQVITQYDSAVYSATGALTGGAIGLCIELATTRYLNNRKRNQLRDQLLQMRDRPDLTPEQQQAIDLTLGIENEP